MPSRRNADGTYMVVNSDSDDSLIADDDDQDFEDRTRSKGKGKAKASTSAAGAGSSKKSKDKGKGKAKEQSYSWEATFKRSWDDVQEDESGNLQGAVDDYLVRARRKRLLGPSTAIRRSIIRHLVIAIDLSASMLDRDLRPTRFELTLEYTREFIREWFDQNPLGQMAIVGMRAGLGERIGDMTGNPQELLNSIADKRKFHPEGEPSLQNVINIARGCMSHLPSSSSREVLIIFGSLTTVDPGNIHETLEECVKDRMAVSVIALAAEMKICREFAEKTGGKFGVVLNEGHFKDLLFELVPPPAQKVTKVLNAAGQPTTQGLTSELLMMGFPVRLPDNSPAAMCVCHSELRPGGYTCPRCLAKLCDIPTDCDICGLMIVSSPHLARSYHHLFPVKAYEAVMEDVDDDPMEGERDKTCHACSAPFKTLTTGLATSTNVAEGISPLGRYRCPECKHDFCANCDIFVHEVVHVCPSCHDRTLKAKVVNGTS